MNIKRITKDAGRSTQYEIRNGSAIILAIVLTTLLAMISVLFLLSSRVDSVATSAIGGNEDLKLAVDSVVAQISEVLTRGVPGVDANGTYYDYPDPCSNIDSWLACLEPYNSGTSYRWRHVTDLYNAFWSSPASRDIQADIIPEYQPTVGSGLPADADGDGVSDSIWVQVRGKVSGKGKPIYAAVRIIDNGGMLNVDTGYKFDPSSSVGTSQSDINLMALAALDHTHTLLQNRLLSYRCGTANASFYEPNVVWQYGLPIGSYTPFDISDELKLRNRYIINYNQDASRIESLWTNAFDGQPYKPRYTPYNDINDPCDWFWIVSNNYPSSCPNPYVYDNRHIATTYNCDRIINPAGSKMLNINSNSPLIFNKDSIYNAVRAALDPCVFSSIDVALITANLMDYVDGPNYPPVGDPRYDPNNEVTGVPDPCNPGTLYYGFERPCVYISEIAQNFYKPADANIDPNIYRSYAIELFKPYWEDDEPNGWRIKTEDVDSDGNPLPNPPAIINWTGSRRFHVLANINTTVPEANIPIDFNDIPGPSDFSGFDPSKLIHQPQTADINFAKDTTIVLQRNVNGYWLTVDVFTVPQAEAYGSGWLDAMDGQPRSFERDITVNRCIRRVLNTSVPTPPTLGKVNSFVATGTEMIQAHPANKTFTNIGEIGQLLSCDQISVGPNSTEAEVRLNLADANVQNLFKYLTVMDPNELRYGGHPYDETRIKGRININTAPWFVLAQLPWVSYQNYNLAQAIVSNRDTYGAFKNTGELMRVSGMGYYQGNAIPVGLSTPTDCNGDAFEERDVIFDRISNLVTVRSDVFTAYILVRLGTDGPQKRVIAIFDRSESPTKKVKVIAIQSVPDPR